MYTIRSKCLSGRCSHRSGDPDCDYGSVDGPDPLVNCEFCGEEFDPDGPDVVKADDDNVYYCKPCARQWNKDNPEEEQINGV